MSLGGVGVQSLEIGDEDLIQKFPFLTSYSATLLLSMSRLLCPKKSKKEGGRERERESEWEKARDKHRSVRRVGCLGIGLQDVA